ncbi:MAG TPA: hypothetical protein VF681_05980 [Abditibacteriaceae bacterium]|jgi:hypothetical protein
MKLSWLKSRRAAGTEKVVLGALLLATAAWPVRAQVAPGQTYSKSLPFSTSGQSMWDGGASEFSYEKFIGVDWNKRLGSSDYIELIITPAFTICDPFEISGCVTVPALSAGTFGGGYHLNTDGKAGLQYVAKAIGGKVDVSYPIELTVNYPAAGVLYPGDTYSITANYAPGATGHVLRTTAPAAQTKLNAVFNANVDFNLSAKAFSENIFSLDFDRNAAFDERIVDTADKDFELQRELGNILAGDFLSTSVGKDWAATEGNLDPATGELRASGAKDLLGAHVDITNMYSVLSRLPAFNKKIDETVTGGKITGELRILDLTEDVKFSGRQNFKFTPLPKLKLRMPDGQIVEMNMGETKTLTFPSVAPTAATNDVTFTPQVDLDHTFTNKTETVLTHLMEFDTFKLAASMVVGKGDISHTAPLNYHPVDKIVVDSAETPVWSRESSFKLGGFNSATPAPFTLVGYTYPKPTLTSITPIMVKAGRPSMTLSAVGTNYVPTHGINPSSTVLWNGSERSTQFVSPTALTAFIPAEDMTKAKEGIVQVSVRNPAPGGGVSAARPFIIDGTGPAIVVTPKPPLLWAPNDKLTAVTVSGKVTDALTGVVGTSVRFAVVDSYKLIQPSGVVTLKADGTYSFTLQLNAKRLGGTDRFYTVTVTASDTVGNPGKTSANVLVPASQSSTTTPPPPVVTVSSVRLSSASATIARGSAPAAVQLNFTGALDSASASDSQNYSVMLNGAPVQVARSIYKVSGNAVVLEFAPNTIKAGNSLSGTFTGLRDASGKTLSGTFGPVVAK